jgi:acetyltransferase-like isoleucine patch superfamily enzyme
MYDEKRTLRQRISKYLRALYAYYLKKVRRVDLGRNCSVARSVALDSINPKGIHIGNNSRISVEVMILAHDYFRGKMWVDTYIGNHCVIGGRTIICPGVKLGDHVFVGAGSIVTKSFPSNCMIAGNPAKIIRTGIKISDKWQIIDFGTLINKREMDQDNTLKMQ